MKKATLILLATLASQSGCVSDEYPAVEVGDVSGTTFYEGAALATTPNPVLVVGAFAYDPTFIDRIVAGERPVPHAVFYVSNPIFPAEGLPYRLSNLEPYEQGYFVTAIIVDVMDATSRAPATGVFPDLGILKSKPDRGPLDVVAGYTRTNVDIRLTDVDTQ